ncbi:hypothetical protein IH601_03350 [Candidatus Bipolaricaulota bacterium]|nr:hypothetical protein [Candidatus Bipolaricaulota bacterium]
MRRFFTLVWLEHRRNWMWSLPLMGSLLFWAWGIKQVTVMDVGERLGIRAGLLAGAITVGALVLCIMIGRIRSETRNGQYQVLLMSPPSGYTHITARFTYAAAVGFAYYITIGFLFWWIFELAGIRFDARSLLELILAMPLYGISVGVLPLLAYTLLLMVFVSAYRISGKGWIPGVVMLLGTPLVLQQVADWGERILWALPSWRVFENVPATVYERFGRAELMSSEVMTSASAQTIDHIGLPIEPMLIALALTVVMLVLAGRIWQEVEA